MSALHVSLGERSYPIFIGSGESRKPENFDSYIASSQVLLVSNSTVAPLYAAGFEQVLKDLGKQVDTLVLPDGEAYKTLDVLNTIFDCLLENSHNRKTTLIALGGGVVGDMVGFAAAAYQRGVDFIQVPSTLLSQVDSSVGGKTGVNHRLGKNMIGAFHQPKAVVIDTDMLKSLPERELSAGIAEIIKYGLIADAVFFEWLECNMPALLQKDEDALKYAIRRSCEIKAEIVAQDERESGIRAILNLGHTFGHAIEASQGYGVWLHGEAVGAGMVMACRMSHKLGWLSADITKRAERLIEKAKLPIAAPVDMSPEVFLKYMAVDKKVLDKSLRLVLLRACGEACVSSDFPESVLMETLKGD